MVIFWTAVLKWTSPNCFRTLENLGQRMTEQQKVFAIIRGLPRTEEYKRISTQILLHHPDDVNETCEQLSQLEAMTGAMSRLQVRHGNGASRFPRARGAYNTRGRGAQRGRGRRQRTCWNCGREGHLQRDCNRPLQERHTQRDNEVQEHPEQTIGAANPEVEHGLEAGAESQQIRPNRTPARGRGRTRLGERRGRGYTTRALMMTHRDIATSSNNRSDVPDERPHRSFRATEDRSGTTSFDRKRKLHRFSAHVTTHMSDWDIVIDSGATTHMTNRKEWLHNLTPCCVEIRAAENTMFLA